MINGKFFTGLPPKMMDRVGSTRNRLESHFFWPDDSTAISATEGRASKHNRQNEKTEEGVMQRQVSKGHEELDTRTRFNREFQRSSIQFCDNLQEQREPNGSLLGSDLITPAPTATQPELPDFVIDKNYANARKQQAFTSKIEFNDMEKNCNKMAGHNIRDPELNTNNKRQVEWSSKNSPKLRNEKAQEKPVMNCIYNRVKETGNGMDNQAYGVDRGKRSFKSNDFRSERNFKNFVSPRHCLDQEYEPTLDYIEKKLKNASVRAKDSHNVKYQNDCCDELQRGDLNNDRFHEEHRISWIPPKHKNQERRSIFPSYDVRNMS